MLKRESEPYTLERARPCIFFLVGYIGIFKHFARLVSYLSSKYDVVFLLTDPQEEKVKKIAEYCEKLNYKFYSLSGDFYGNTTVRIPILRVLRNRYLHSRACRTFLRMSRPAKIISPSIRAPYDTLLKEANALGIETIFLQWVFPANHYIFPNALNAKRIRRMSLNWSLYSFLLWLSCAVLDLGFREARYAPTWAIPKKIGVFDEKSAKQKSRDFDRRTIRITPTIDFQLVHELKRKTHSDPFFKKMLLEKHGLSENKTKIVVILFRFYALKDKNRGGEFMMKKSEHIAHYYNVFKIIRSIFPEDESEIILKMHPSEKNMYESYKTLGVKMYHDESRTDELICLSDLYISDPTTNVNNMAIASDIPAIFLNLSRYSSLNNCMPLYGITHTISTEQEFLSELKSFREGSLRRYYDNSHVDVRSVETLVRLIDS